MANTKQGRGELTERVKTRTKELFGYEFNVRELRLLPYIQFTMMNSQKLDPNKINKEERDILSKWRKAGHIEGGAGGMRISRDFWFKMNEILLMAYVDID